MQRTDAALAEARGGRQGTVPLIDTQDTRGAFIARPHGEDEGDDRLSYLRWRTRHPLIGPRDRMSIISQRRSLLDPKNSLCGTHLHALSLQPLKNIVSLPARSCKIHGAANPTVNLYGRSARTCAGVRGGYSGSLRLRNSDCHRSDNKLGKNIDQNQAGKHTSDTLALLESFTARRPYRSFSQSKTAITCVRCEGTKTVRCAICKGAVFAGAHVIQYSTAQWPAEAKAGESCRARRPRVVAFRGFNCG